jgi:hypothetical protein
VVHPENAAGVIAPSRPPLIKRELPPTGTVALAGVRRRERLFDLVRGGGKKETPTYTWNRAVVGPGAATPSLMKCIRQGALREPVVSRTRMAAGFEHGLNWRRNELLSAGQL